MTGMHQQVNGHRVQANDGPSAAVFCGFASDSAIGKRSEGNIATPRVAGSAGDHDIETPVRSTVHHCENVILGWENFLAKPHVAVQAASVLENYDLANLIGAVLTLCFPAELPSPSLRFLP